MKRIAWLSAWWALWLGPVWAAGEGLFADFSTSLGDFTVQLDYERAPRAVASFAGLATGESGWLDAQSNVWHRPFYDGSLFHRVVKEGGNRIAIQGGARISVSGGVTNLLGPGYAMLENVTNGLAHSNGVISMANSGPNTDGSQFFITTTNVPYWNGGYSVFGRVDSGMDVVEALAAVAVDPADRPVEDLWIRHVAIRRIGAAAEGFDLTAQGVPTVEFTPMSLYWTASNLTIAIELASQTKPPTLWVSQDLQAWNSERLLTNFLFYTGAATILSGTVDRTVDPRGFFLATRIRYPVPITAPASHRGRTFTFWWDAPELTYQATFATTDFTAGTGWVQVGTNAPYPRAIYMDEYTQEAYMARLEFVDDLGRQYQYSLGFNPGQTTNRFTGNWGNYATPALRYALSGVFTVQ